MHVIKLHQYFAFYTKLFTSLVLQWTVCYYLFPICFVHSRIITGSEISHFIFGAETFTGGLLEAAAGLAQFDFEALVFDGCFVLFFLLSMGFGWFLHGGGGALLALPADYAGGFSGRFLDRPSSPRRTLVLRVWHLMLYPKLRRRWRSWTWKNPCPWFTLHFLIPEA